MKISMFTVVFISRNSLICQDYPKMIALTYGFTFSTLAAKLMLKTIENADYFDQDCYYHNIFYYLSFALSIMSYNNQAYGYYLDIVFGFFFINNLCSMIIFLSFLCNEMSDVLGVYVFLIGKKPIKSE